MKRKVKERRAELHRIWDPKKDLPEKQLAAIGATCLAWNEAEATFDVLFCVVSMVPRVLWRDVATRINGIEGKVAIIRAAAEDRFGIREGWLHEAIIETLAVTTDYRKYRDLVAHSRIIDKFSNIGESALKRGDVHEVLMTESALAVLYDHMRALTNELYALVTWFQTLREFYVLDSNDNAIPHLMAEQMAERVAAMREGVPGVLGLGIGAVPDKQQISEEAQFAFSRYSAARDQRRSLKPLPPFPTESQDPQGTEVRTETHE